MKNSHAKELNFFYETINNINKEIEFTTNEIKVMDQKIIFIGENINLIRAIKKLTLYLRDRRIINELWR